MVYSTKLTTEERETHFYINEAENSWIVDTSIRKDINKLIKLGWEVIGEDTTVDGKVIAMRFKAPRKSVSFRNPAPSKRVMTEEQKQKAAERMREYQEAKRQKKAKK